ncbi:hypothetical protein BKP42_68260 [Rhodococcus erythropolis]|jgi:hypothetical protein|nr:hypothetical protein BKP42_68260 [Rhodococcus erythropolis]
MIAGGWIWSLPLPWEWRIALSEVTPCRVDDLHISGKISLSFAWVKPYQLSTSSTYVPVSPGHAEPSSNRQLQGKPESTAIPELSFHSGIDRGLNIAFVGTHVAPLEQWQLLYERRACPHQTWQV